MKTIIALIKDIFVPVALVLAICLGVSFWLVNYSGVEFTRVMTPHVSTVSELRQFERFKDVNIQLVSVSRIDIRN